jgi:hypothetical protein
MLAPNPDTQTPGAPSLAPAAGMGSAPPGAPMPAPKWHDVTIVRRKNVAQARVEGVPPEEFGIARSARSIRTAGYCFHRVLRSHADLIADGYDETQVASLPSYVAATNVEELARDTINESTLRASDDGINKANRQIWVTEHYIRMDYEGDGKARLYRVTTGGAGSGEDTILTRADEDEATEVDAIPFAAMTPVIMTHRFFGRSIADLVMDIQRIKTALLRSLLDNAYLANNPRTEVPESHATETTLDDLLISRPGGIVRTRQPGGLNVIQHPDIGEHVFPLLQYQDATREWRTGVSRQGQGVDPNALQNQVATIANQMFNAAQAKMKLVARIFAETGIKDLFLLLHATIRRHGSQPQTVQLRSRWVEVDPRDWQMRNDMTVNVGLGTGSKAEQLAHLQMVIAAQEKAINAGMVSPKNLWASAQELIKLIGRKDPEAFFTPPGRLADPNDPSSAPIQPPPDPKHAEAQGRLQLDQAKAQADLQMAAQRNQADAQSAIAKIQSEAELKRAQLAAEFDLKREQMTAEFALKREQMAAEIALRREQMALDAETRRHAAGAGHIPARAGVAGPDTGDATIDGVKFGGEVG